MRKILVILMIMTFALTGYAFEDEPEAREIMQKVQDRDDGDDITSDMKMILIDKNGSERVRDMRSFSKDKGEDTMQLMFFTSPADVKDTGFLTYDYDDPDKDDDQWLYLPALKKTKRIASDDKSGSFMGSDFNYSDMTERELPDWRFRIIKEMNVKGEDVWVIEAEAVSEAVADETGYSKSYLFIRKDNYTLTRAVHWENTGGDMKYLDVIKMEKIDGIWMNREVHMTKKSGNVTKHKTVMKIDNIKLYQDLSEDMFTIRRLEKGL
ncbi:outer membrane lipoprotein-sorting protein [Limisalsivibrio acetivorans]|uniref:outer membrane lipoprotein-sorting protein n=1 Tax=Limisalsivibrio acetivorans TaxID=1304888 RepID=UPI0003B3D794|nr:outer membrane lipoprotein-sorting protein [Limisalsivibrio acetivorans]